jgi:two-component system sensor histidine kinase and response regulator WspE
VSNDTPDESLLDLYRSEAETQCAVLAQGLVELSSDLANPKKIEPAARAAHSLKGAARIVGLDPPVQLANIMEEILIAAQQGKRALDQPTLDVLLRATDWLAQSAQSSVAELAAPPAPRLAEHAACLAALQSLAAQGGVVPPKKPAPAASAPPPAPPPIPAPQPSAPPAPSPSAANRKPAASLTNSPFGSAKLDLSLLDLYRTEAETQLGTFVQRLVDLENDLTNQKNIEPLMRAAHSLKGAARIIGLDSVVKLAHAMEDAFVAAQENKLTLNSASIDVFLRSADWLAQFSKLPVEQLVAPPPDQRAILSACLADVQAVLAGRPPEPKAKTETAPAPAEAAPPPPTTPAAAPETPVPAPAAPAGDKPVSHHVTRAPQGPVPASADSVVRVSAASLTRLMGLAAETLVETRRLQPFREALLKLKNAQLNFVSELEDSAETPAAAAVVGPLRPIAQANLDAIRAQLEVFDAVVRRNTLLSGRLYQEVIASRMRPFGDGAQGFPRLIRDVSRALGKSIRFDLDGRETPVDRDILERLEAPLNHLLRNACDHGIDLPEQRRAAGKPETGLIRLVARHRAGMLVIQVIDDGKGVPIPRLRQKIVEKGQATADMAAHMSDDEVLQFLFLPGFSTAEKVTEYSGRGVGLDVVHTLMQEVGGTVRINTTEGRGTTFTLQLPITRSVLRALMVEIEGEPYAFPLSRLSRAERVPYEAVKTIENRPYLIVDGANVGLVPARTALGLPGEGRAAGPDLSVVVVGDGKILYGLEVDRILGESDLVVRPLDPRLGKVPGISSASLSEDGAPILIVDVDDLVVGLEKLLAGGQVARGRRQRAVAQVVEKRILVVDDSLTVRETERQLLENAGFDVEVAVDGADGWNAVRLGQFDLVVSDLDMPRLNGFEFVKRIRGDTRLQRLPVIIVSYKDREEDRLKGLEAGADYYLTKSSFQDDTFLRAVTDLIGAADAPKQ